MDKMKILFSCIGRRVELTEAFRAAAENLKIPLEIWGSDYSESAPALLFCDKRIKALKINDDGYIPQLLKVCEDNGIDAVIPTIDTDLLKLSQNKHLFREIGTQLVISDEDKIRICRDKRVTANYFKSVGLKCPETFDDFTKYDKGYPAFIKPKDGSSSIFAYKAENCDELKAYAEQVPEYIIQPYIKGTEYTVDVFCDFEGEPVYITPRIRLAVRSGEVLKTEIVNDEKIISEIKSLISDYKPCGAITVQLIREEKSGVDHYIEINPRFGGGAPLSIKAGAESPEALLRLLNKEKLTYTANAAEDGLIFSRFDQSVCVGGKPGKTDAVIFDLDDTLYNEIDYVKSGFKAAAAELSGVENAYEKLYAAFLEKKSAIDEVICAEGLGEDVKKKCVEAYREHKPDITLSEEVRALLTGLKERGIKIGIITDGRPSGQRNKISALGLDKIADAIVISDEIGGVGFRKPSDIPFRIMQKKLGVPFKRMIYVGDSMKKDIMTPRQLGMYSILYANKDGLYYDPENKFKDRIESLNEIPGYIK